MRPTHYLAVLLTNQNQYVEADVPQINLGELVKNQKNWDTISLSSFHPTLCFCDFGKFDCTQHVDWGILLHTSIYNFSDT